MGYRWHEDRADQGRRDLSRRDDVGVWPIDVIRAVISAQRMFLTTATTDSSQVERIRRVGIDHQHPKPKASETEGGYTGGRPAVSLLVASGVYLLETGAAVQAGGVRTRIPRQHF